MASKPLTLTGRRLGGYGAVYGAGYPLYAGAVERERVAPGALTPIDLELVSGHSGPVLASVRGGTLDAVSDDYGLRVESDLDEADPDVQRLLPKMRRGDVTGLSVGMYIRDAGWVDEVWEIRAAEVFEVAVVGRPAQPLAQATLRSGTPSPEAVRRAPSGLYVVRGALPFVAAAMSDRDAVWDGADEVARSVTETVLRRMHAWVDPEIDLATRGSYRLPHHRATGEVVWRGVASAMGVLLGGGADIPTADHRGVWEHLAGHYRQFNEVPPALAG